MTDERAPACSLTWWGHATTTIEIGGQRILTDPVLTRRLAHLGRVRGPIPHPRAGDADVVLISHLHGDHLHVPSLLRLPAGTRVVAPHGSARVLARKKAWAGRLEEVDVDDVVSVGGLTIRAVPARHDGRRHPRSRVHGPALGYVIEGDDSRVWFAGDTGLFAAMADLGPVDLAVVPIGGWGPSLGPEHLDPVGAAEAVRLVQARHTVPIHYGTFWPIGLRHVHRSNFRRLFEQPAGRFAEEIAAQTSATAHILAVGESTTWAAL